MRRRTQAALAPIFRPEPRDRSRVPWSPPYKHVGRNAVCRPVVRDVGRAAAPMIKTDGPRSGSDGVISEPRRTPIAHHTVGIREPARITIQENAPRAARHTVSH
jgi:hypothetical protein